MAGQQEITASVLDTVGVRPMVAHLAFVTPEPLAAVADFEAQQGDVMIVTYPKCGTTWCQQLCHQIRTGGHTEFDEISEERIVPWLEVAPFIGIDSSLPQIAEPRCFKTHQMLSALSCLEARGAQYLCVLRDPETAMLSEFKFMVSKCHPRADSKDVNVFATSCFLPSVAGGAVEYPPWFGGYVWEYYIEFWRCRALPNVRLIAFEHLKRDLGSQIPVIADFMGISQVSSELHAKVMELGSFAWMQANDHLFDANHMPVRLARMKGKGKGKGKGDEGGKVFKPTTKVGLQVGDDVNTAVTEETRALLARAWREMVTPVTGHESYQAMIDELQTSRS